MTGLFIGAFSNTGLWLILFSLIYYMIYKIKEQEKIIEQIR